MVNRLALIVALGIALTVCPSRISAAVKVLESDLKATKQTIGLVEAIHKKNFDEFLKVLTGTEELDVDQPTPKGLLPIVEASKTRETRFVDSLIQYGATVQGKCLNTGSTGLHIAFQFGLADMSKVLLAYGADANATDKKGQKPIDVANSAEIKKMYSHWIQEGAVAFEDPPGTWTKQQNDNGVTFWYNKGTHEGRWDLPPSCAWQRVEEKGVATHYNNFVTGQVLHRTPPSLCWRKIRQSNAAFATFWYNWAVNKTQVDAPDEMPQYLLEEAEKLINTRWYNKQTGEFSFENPKLKTHWREVTDPANDKIFYHNIVTGESIWEIPEELAWKEDVHEGSTFWWNERTSATTWEKPDILGWEEHTDDMEL